MKKIVSTLLVVVLLLTVFGSSVASSFGDDWMYDIAYNAGVQAAEEAGYTNYEIIVDDDYNVTINVLDEPKATDPPAEETPAKKEEEQKADSDVVEEEPAEKLSSEEEYALGIQELENENIVDAMQHFLRALPNEDAEKMISENASDYVDELIFAEDYQTAQVFMLEHPFEGYEQFLAECNDYCFLLDLAKALNARWSVSNTDTSTMSDKKVREFYQQLVESETQYLDKYMSLGFSDPQLANYAYAYIGALQSQMTGAAYYGVDNEKYNENWIDHGRYVRSRLIYLINKKYGIETDSSHDKSLKELVTEGYNLDFVFAVSESLTEQLSSKEISFTKYRDGDKSKGQWVELAPFTIKNTSGYNTENIDVDAVFLDERGHVVDRADQIFLIQTTRDGEDYKWRVSDGYMVSEPFASFYFEVKIEDLNWDRHFININPLNQTAWDGKEIVVNGYKASSSQETSVALEETSAYWTVQNGYFVPCIEFILRNDGKADIKEAAIECVFIEKENNKEWSRDRYFAISSSDTPLHSGQGRNVIVYSSSGYEKKTRKVPDLVVEVYINNKPVAKIDVTKP